MSAVDKLHKLYSSTLEPVVWARSVGLDVLNEFDSVKAAIMMDAGASGGRRHAAGGDMWWDMTAKGVEGLARGATAVKIVGQGIVGMVGATLRNVPRATGLPDQQK
jgi:ubiquinone biosynthesis monooxygenase Coq6